MKLAIMQPYFCPYIGYFQLMNAVDKFIVYDNIQYTKKGWINRNRILVNGKDQFITLPLKKDSDYLNINQRFLADDFDKERVKLLSKIRGVYTKAPYFKVVFPMLETIISCKEENLFDYIYYSLIILKEFLGIKAEIIKSTDLKIEMEQYKGEDKVLKICKYMNASIYINNIGGIELYKREHFLKEGFDLSFLRSVDVKYQQFTDEFIPWLSIIDIIMFNDVLETKRLIRENVIYETN